MTRVREVIAVSGALLALLLLAVTLQPILLTRPLWLDEVHTLLVASRATPAQVISSLTGGIDTAPGLYHLALWALGKITGSLSPVVLHGVALVSVWLCLGFTYAALRRRFSVVPSVAAVLAVGTHSLVIQMTYEARFYGPWLLFAAAFAWSLGLPRSRGRDAWIAGISILLCTIHWFGVVSLALMCAAALAVHLGGDARGRHHWREGFRLIAPSAAGVVVLVFCAPILLGQRAAVTAPTWIPAPSPEQAWVMARTFYVGLVPILALVMILASRLRPTPPAVASPNVILSEAKDQLSGIVALAALAPMPVAIAVISFILQPTLLDRYATVAALAWAPLVAFALQTQGRRVQVLFCALLFCVGFVNYRRSARGMLSYRRVLDADVRSFDLAITRTNLGIVFQSRHVQYPLVTEQPLGRERTIFLSLPDSTIDAMFPANSEIAVFGPFFRFEREAALLQERIYGSPRILSQAQLDTTSRFLLLASDASLPGGYKNVERFTQVVFPHHTVTRLETNLSLLTRRGSLSR